MAKEKTFRGCVLEDNTKKSYQNKKIFTCAEEACDMKWSEWSECSAYCGRGSRRRKTMCSLSRGGESKLCKDLNLKDQDFEHIQDCNTWNRETCPR